MVEEYHFHRIDASRSIREVFQDLKSKIEEALVGMKPISLPDAEKKLVEARAED
jgi:hypothetical protein